MSENPFHPLEPPGNPTLFFGRDDAIAFIRRYLVGVYNVNVPVILGRAGMGKTALLRQIPYLVDERYQPVYISTADVDMSNPRPLMATLVRAIITRMEIIGASTYRLPPLPEESAPIAEWLRWFADDFLEVVISAIRRERFLLLLIDDFDRILEAVDRGDYPADFVQYPGKLLEQYDRLDITVGLDIAFEQRIFKIPALADSNFHFRLQHLTDETARKLVVESVAEQYEYSDDALTYILKLAGGYPFLLHSVCRLIYRRREGTDRTRPVNIRDVEAIYPAALEETREIVRPLMKRLPDNDLHIIRVLLEYRQQFLDEALTTADLLKTLKHRRIKFNHTGLVSRLRSLEYETLIQTTLDGACYFSTALEADWIQQNHDFSGLAVPQPSGKSRLYSLAIGAILMFLLALGVFFVIRQTADDSNSDVDDGSPPTSTLEVDIQGTQQALDDTATARAIPSSTRTPSPTASDTSTYTPTATPTATMTAPPSNTAMATRTPTATRTLTNTPIPTDTLTLTEEPTQTRTPELETVEVVEPPGH